MERNIKCYICGGDAVERDAPNTSGNVIVDCSYCKSIGYEVASGARNYYLDRYDILNEEDREKLSQHIRKPVLITIEIIEKATGKKSVHE